MLRDETIRLPDGRMLAFAAWGDPTGRPLLRFHGTPGSRHRRPIDAGVYERVGVHVVTFDRPGYGGSTAHRDRTLFSVAEDALELVDALGWEQFSVLGSSGGGPHALALGLRAPGRVVRIGLAVGAVPRNFVDESELIGVNREGYRRAASGRAALEAFMSGFAAQLVADPAGTLDAMMKDAPVADRAALERAEVKAVMMDEAREAFRSGPTGWYDDAWVLSQPWDSILNDVRAPVWIWHADLDRNSPLPAMRRLASQVNLASFTELPGRGHLAAIDREEELLTALIA